MSGTASIVICFGGQRLQLAESTTSDLSKVFEAASALTKIPSESLHLVASTGESIINREGWARLVRSSAQASTSKITLFAARGKTRPRLVATELPSDWADACSRIWLGNQSVAQPHMIHQNQKVCRMCANTCFLPGQLTQPNARDITSPIVCQCNGIASHECLFAARLNSDSEVTDQPLKEKLVQLYKNQLPKEEATRSISFPPEKLRAFQNRLFSGLQQVRSYEDELLQSQALSVIPEDTLQERAGKVLESTCKSECTKEDYREELLKQLLHWFKKEFFKWVNQPKCPSCNVATKPQGVTQPSPDDYAHGARVVELYSCPQCGTCVRFPRYNSPAKLLETREGRCGEWANCFTLCCIAMGYEARWVLDFTDHVWTEVYCEKKKRWVHLDPCEDAYDSPKMYEVGWGKKLTYIFGFSVNQVVDVSRRYTRKYKDMLQRRTEVPEEWLQAQIAQMNEQILGSLPSGIASELRARFDAEQEELSKVEQEIGTKLNEHETVGRESGSVEWKQSRGEMGETQASYRCSSDVFKGSLPSHIQTQAVSVLEASTNRAVNSSSWIANGSAVVDTKADRDVFVLTEAVPDRAGSVWLRKRVDISQGFVAEFTFVMSGGADGMAFVIQNTSEEELGETGCQLGYGGIKNSLAVEFDTYYSRDMCDDPNDNHISINTRGTQANTAEHSASLGIVDSNIPSLADRNPHHVRVVYWKGEMSVYIDSDVRPVLSVKVDLAQRLALGNVESTDLPSQLSKYTPVGYAWLGFTASTGGLSQCHLVTGFVLHRLVDRKLSSYQPYVYDQINPAGMLKKIDEFNKIVQPDLQFGASAFESLRSNLSSLNQGIKSVSPSLAKALCEDATKICSWPLDMRFPGIDLMRWLAQFEVSHENLLSSPLMTDIDSFIDHAVSEKADSIYRTVLFRAFANLISFSSVGGKIYEQIEKFIKAVPILSSKSLQLNESVALFASLYNISGYVATTESLPNRDEMLSALVRISQKNLNPPAASIDVIHFSGLILRNSIVCGVVSLNQGESKAILRDCEAAAKSAAHSPTKDIFAAVSAFLNDTAK